MIWSSVTGLHAALNDLPPALLVAALAFDLAGAWTKRESLKAAGFWTLTVAAGGALLAVLSGLRAEAVIEHGSVMHRTIERHETLAITATVLIVGLAGWRVWRRQAMPMREHRAYLASLAITTLGIVWTASVGGRIVFDHAGGIETRVLESAVAERTAGHEHAPGEEHEQQDAEGSATDVGENAGEDDNTHPAGTPPHQHE
jgi:uncharacterized membrane protein